MRVPALLLAVLLAACSTEGKVTPLTTSGAALPAAKTWSVAVTGCRPTECVDIRTSVIARLIGAGLVEGVSQPAPLALEIAVERTRSVSTAERVFFGAMAGRNEVEALVTLRDAQGAALRSFRAQSGSAAHPFSGETSAQDAYRQFGNDIVAGLRS